MLCTRRVSLLGLMLASIGVSNAVRETMSVTEDGITFTVVGYEDVGPNPYRLKFRQEDTRSLLTFNSAAQVTNLKVGEDERYKMLYDSSNNLVGVELRPSIRRALAGEEDDVAAVEGRRLDFDNCAVCEDVWVSLCAGVSSVCDLVDYGSPFSTTGAESVDTVCGTFGSACSSYEASEACQGQCTAEEASFRTACLSPTNDRYKCSFSGDTSMLFEECDLTDRDVPHLPECFEEFGKTNIQRLDLEGYQAITAFPEGTFSGLSELTILQIDNNVMTTVPEGLFDGLTKLEFLDMSANGLASLPEAIFSDLASLQTLDLADNDLSPEALPIGLFAGVPLLQELRLGQNALKDITDLEGLLDGLTELTSLELGGDELLLTADSFEGFENLESLSLEFNAPTTLPEGLFSGLMALRILKLRSDVLLLSEDAFVGLVSLERLDIGSSGLTTLPAGVFSPLVNLVEIDFSHNGNLQCLPFTTASDVVLDSEDVRDGTCECTPEEAVVCDDGLTCQGGMTGYTCVAE